MPDIWNSLILQRMSESVPEGVLYLKFSLDIDYSIDRIERSRKRMLTRYDFKYDDRVPVGFCLCPRYFAPRFGISYKDIFKDAQTQYYLQLQFAKYRIENIPEDNFCQDTVISVAPYFDNVKNSGSLGAHVVWPDNETPHALPAIDTIEQMNKFEIPSATTGLWGKMLDWWSQMKQFAAETRISFDGKEGRVEVAPPNIGGEGPHMMAIDLAGEKFYWWMLEYPQECHNFLFKITRAMILAEESFRKIDPRPRTAFGLAEDSAQVISAEMFRRFVVPYDNMLYDAFGRGLKDGRGMHMCGKSEHLHKGLIEDLHISSFNLFGYQVETEVAAKNFGGKAYLWGNLNPLLLLQGSAQEVKTAALKCLEILSPCGGFMLGDGANICPGTPLKNLAALTEAVEEYRL